MKIRSERFRKPNDVSRTILALVVLILSTLGTISPAFAEGQAALMNQVTVALRGNERLNGAKA